jgi:hypothetical protein
LVSGKILLCVNGVDWALRYANCTIDASVRVNGKKIGAFNKAINWANIHTVGVFALDTALCHNMGHSFLNTVLGLNKAF